VSFENVTVQGSVFLNPVLEEYAVNKKKDVFEKSFKKKVLMTWNQGPTPSAATVPATTDRDTTADRTIKRNVTGSTELTR
jgi:hypothetical protein